MGLTLVTGPVVEPVTLADLKAHLNVTTPDDDAKLAGYLFAARRHAEDYIRGKLITQTWDYTVDYGWPVVMDGCLAVNRIYLPLHPLQSVTSVSYVDEAGATQTLSAALYTVHIDKPVPYIQRAYNATWPSVRVVPSAITVRFVCGYTQATVPDEIRTAIMMHVQSIYDCEDKGECETCRDALLDPHRVVVAA